MLRDLGIEATLGTYAMHAEPAFMDRCGTTPGDLPASYRLVGQTLALPVHQGLDERDMERVASAVGDVIAEPAARRR